MKAKLGGGVSELYHVLADVQRPVAASVLFQFAAFMNPDWSWTKAQTPK